MAVACFSLIGLPLTIGFFGKFYLIRPALLGKNYWLVVITMINAAISAVYYLRIVGTMFLKPEPTGPQAAPGPSIRSIPVTLAIGLSVAGTILFGAIFPATEMLGSKAESAASLEQRLFGGETTVFNGRDMPASPAEEALKSANRTPPPIRRGLPVAQ